MIPDFPACIIFSRRSNSATSSGWESREDSCSLCSGRSESESISLVVRIRPRSASITCITLCALSEVNSSAATYSLAFVSNCGIGTHFLWRLRSAFSLLAFEYNVYGRKEMIPCLSSLG